MSDVFDAETGEKLEVMVWSPAKSGSPSQRQQEHQQPPTRALRQETQSQRVLGDYVDWQRQQAAKVAKAEKGFRESLAGIRHELQRQGLSDDQRLRLTMELLEKTKLGYARHLQGLVVEELAREMDREVALRLELAPLGLQRMHRRHDKERAFHRQQIARVREECEMALTAAAAKSNLLR